MESLWTFEHVGVPLEYDSRYPGHPSGKMPGTPENHFIDSLIVLSHVAAHPKTLRLVTGVNLVPQTNPPLLAKQVAGGSNFSPRLLFQWFSHFRGGFFIW